MAGTSPAMTQRINQFVLPVHTALPIHCANFCFGAAPTWREAISPFLNIIKVGIDMMPYFAAVFGFSSTLSLTILTFSPSCSAISSSAGAIMRHGPHHSAQKSTTTGADDLRTSDSKFASDTLPTAMGPPLVADFRAWRRGSAEPMNAVPQRQATLTPA